MTFSCSYSVQPLSVPPGSGLAHDAIRFVAELACHVSGRLKGGHTATVRPRRTM